MIGMRDSVTQEDWERDRERKRESERVYQTEEKVDSMRKRYRGFDKDNGIQ